MYLFFSGVTGETRAIVAPENLIPRKKIRIKSLATFPPRKDPIPNQDKNTFANDYVLRKLNIQSQYVE